MRAIVEAQQVQLENNTGFVATARIGQQAPQTKLYPSAGQKIDAQHRYTRGVCARYKITHHQDFFTKRKLETRQHPHDITPPNGAPVGQVRAND